jgi:hypothetical protein
MEEYVRMRHMTTCPMEWRHQNGGVDDRERVVVVVVYPGVDPAWTSASHMLHVV